MYNKFYEKKLRNRDAKTLYYNSIITQRNFHNSINIDKKSVFGEESKKRILVQMIHDHNNKKQCHANKYVTTLLKHKDGTIPKSNTCCWRLSKNYDDWCMYQYFVSPQYIFGIDLLSNVLSVNNDVGATFMSSLFYHCTKIPIWKNTKNNQLYLEGPKDIYNFAWGSNGTTKEK